MKSVVVSRGKFEITRAMLNKPAIMVGRSPVCDIVLRAPDVKPLHFLIEWIGDGTFDPDQDNWIITNISEGADVSSAESTLLSTGIKAEVDGFVFATELSTYAQAALLGGTILTQVTVQKSQIMVPIDEKLVEVVWLRSISGAVEEVVHKSPFKLNRKTTMIPRLPKFKVEMSGNSNLKLHFEDLNGISVFKRGEAVAPEKAELSTTDFMQIKWNKDSLFLRFVNKVAAPPVRWQGIDILLLKTTLFSAVLFSFLFALSFIEPEKKVELVGEPPRVARIEIKEIFEAPPAQKVEPIIDTQPDQTKPSNMKSAKAGIAKDAGAKNPGPIAKNRVESQTAAENAMGLNAPGKPTDMNSVGILGLLKQKKGRDGQRINADLIINQGVQTQILEGDNSKGIVIKNPPSGDFGTGSAGTPKGTKDGQNLAAATTLRSGDAPDTTSLGPIAKENQSPQMFAGTGLGKNGKGVGSGKVTGSFDTEDLNVSGGLNRETVRRVIAAYRGKVRTCYDKSLMVNPKVGGRVVYRWVISPVGGIVETKILRSTVSSPVLESCVLDVINGMTFPKAPNGKATIVIYPFEFFTKN